MFISKAEKENLHSVIAQLQHQVSSLTDRCENLSESYKSLKLRLNELSVHQIAKVTGAATKAHPRDNIEHIKHERKKASMRENYHRRKAERLENEAKLKLDLAVTPSLQLEETK
jgi:chromosome segregation ATPase